MFRPGGEYDTEYKKCLIEIEGVSYSAVFQEHRIVSEALDINGNMLVNYTIIRKYILEKLHPSFKANRSELRTILSSAHERHFKENGVKWVLFQRKTEE